PCLVEVDERAQRARALLVKDGARAREPVVCLVGPAGQPAELRHRQARVDAWLAEVAGERLLEQVALQDAGEVGSAQAPERLAAVADRARVTGDAPTCALDGWHRTGHGAQRILVASSEGEQNRPEGVGPGATPDAPCRVVARESSLGG